MTDAGSEPGGGEVGTGKGMILPSSTSMTAAPDPGEEGLAGATTTEADVDATVSLVVARAGLGVMAAVAAAVMFALLLPLRRHFAN